MSNLISMPSISLHKINRVKFSSKALFYWLRRFLYLRALWYWIGCRLRGKRGDNFNKRLIKDWLKFSLDWLIPLEITNEFLFMFIFIYFFVFYLFFYHYGFHKRSIIPYISFYIKSIYKPFKISKCISAWSYDR